MLSFGCDKMSAVLTWLGICAKPPEPDPTYLALFLSFVTRSAVKELLFALANFVFVIWLLKFLLRMLDPTYDSKAMKEAKIKLNKILKKRGQRAFSLNKHEKIIAGLLVDPDDMKTSWADIGGLDEILKNTKRTVINPILIKQKRIPVSRYAKPPQGVLLYGPPGCGKTTIAKAMAKESGCWFINMSASALLNMYFGETEKLINAAFTFAAKVSPCIIFIDEIESILGKRRSRDHELTKNVKTLFMTLWDGLLKDENKIVIVFGATNRPKDLDPAVLRRMTRKLHIPLPNLQQRQQILNLILKDQKLSNDVSADAIADLTEEFSGADLEEVLREAVIMALPDAKEVSLPCYNTYDGSERLLTRANKLLRELWYQKYLQWYELFFSRQPDEHQKKSKKISSPRPITMADFQTVINDMRAARSDIEGSGNNMDQLNVAFNEFMYRILSNIIRT